MAIFAGVLASSLHVLLHLLSLIVVKYLKASSLNRFFLYSTIIRFGLSIFVIYRLGQRYEAFIAYFAISVIVSYGLLSILELLLIKNKLDRSFFRNA